MKTTLSHAWCFIRLFLCGMWAGWGFDKGDLVIGHLGVFMSLMMALQWGYEYFKWQVTR